jgi:hypothetical protein
MLVRPIQGHHHAAEEELGPSVLELIHELRFEPEMNKIAERVEWRVFGAELKKGGSFRQRSKGN